jgi:hypothetical protein
MFAAGGAHRRLFAAWSASGIGQFLHMKASPTIGSVGIVEHWPRTG